MPSNKYDQEVLGLLERAVEALERIALNTKEKQPLNPPQRTDPMTIEVPKPMTQDILASDK